MKVKDVMTRDVISVSPKTKVIEAAKKMKSANIHTVLVIQDRKLAGIVVDRDLVLRVLAEGRNPAKVHVDEIMTRGANYCRTRNQRTRCRQAHEEAQNFPFTCGGQ